VSAPRGLALSIRGLEVRYPGSPVPVLRGLDLEVPAGTTVAVVGESGSGKTVLVRALLGMAPVRRGALLLDGLDLRSLGRGRRAALRRRIGTVFQSPVDSLDPRWTARRTVAEGLSLRLGGGLGTHLGEAGNLLDRVGIAADRWDARPGALSGGECQRVAVARAVAGGPALVLADEPTAMLDPDVGRQVLDLLTSLQSSMGFTLVLVTHHLRELDRVPGGLLVLCAGRPAERTVGYPENPRHPFSRHLWDAAVRPVAPVELAAEGCPFRPGCPRALPGCAEGYPDPWQVEEGWVVWCRNPPLL